MTGISAAHDAFSDVNARTGQIPLTVYVNDFVDRAAVNAHSQGDPRMFFQGPRNFYGALRRRLGICAENKRHPITSR